MSPPVWTHPSRCPRLRTVVPTREAGSRGFRARLVHLVPCLPLRLGVRLGVPLGAIGPIASVTLGAIGRPHSLCNLGGHRPHSLCNLRGHRPHSLCDLNLCTPRWTSGDAMPPRVLFPFPPPPLSRGHRAQRLGGTSLLERVHLPVRSASFRPGGIPGAPPGVNFTQVQTGGLPPPPGVPRGRTFRRTVCDRVPFRWTLLPLTTCHTTRSATFELGFWLRGVQP